MSVFRARNDAADSFTVSSRILANDLIYGSYGRAAGDMPGAVSAAILSPAPHAIIDTVPGDTSTTATLTVDAAPTISGIDMIADEDFYRITLVAGHEYQIGMYGYTPSGPGDPVGPNGVPLADSFIELYDSAGNLITSADGGSDTTLNSANSGFDALLTFTATTTGTYYVDARAFDNSPADGSDRGDLVGDYGLYAKDVTGDELNYTPYYDANSPLYAIDWGTMVNKVHQTYRNPDGDEGTRDTGNLQSSVDPGAAFGFPGKNVITIYFAKAGDTFVSNDPTNPGLPPATITATGVQQFEHDAVMTALGEFSKVADLVYVEVNDRANADFIYTSYIGTPGPGISLLGSMSPPDEPDEGLAQFNSGDYRWNATDLQQGGFSFTTLIHEFGHGHGLAHPHDNGGHSGIMHGVQPEGAGVADYTTGDYDLNQGVFTMMSYEDGWQDSPYGNAPTSGGYGYLGGLMAFDIAAIQDKYGVNEDWATGDDTYVLKDVNAPGTYFTSIWDAGGTDSIVYSGTRDANIDLRPATLQYEWGGGGWVSYAYGIYGGFTIANGVTIENATSGAGNDTLIGNDAANVLNGGGGVDVMTGGLGNDTYFVDNAGDAVVESAGAGLDLVYTDVSYVLSDNVERLGVNGFATTYDVYLTGNGLDNEMWGNDGRNILDGGAGADIMHGNGGDDIYFVDNVGDVVLDSSGFDLVYTSVSYTLGANVERLGVNGFTTTYDVNLTGNDLDNEIWGNDGRNVLDGGAGADILHGNGGDDTYFVDNVGDVVLEGSGGGFDLIYTSVSYTLDANVERLGVNGFTTTYDINLTGNDLSNEIWGNDGRNILDGGAGADILHGNGGDDVYIVDNAGDVVIESAGAGFDLVYTSVNYTLGANVERLGVNGFSTTYAINLTGNGLDNEIWGNDGANVLDGGLGADILHGNGGADSFAFTTALGGGNIDTILDFAPGADKITLDDAVFTAVGGLGALNPNAFFVGTAAHDADDRIVYDQASGNLYYDADGNGAGAAVLFATLQGAPTIAASDFTVI